MTAAEQVEYDIPRHELLTAEDEVRLAIQVRAGHFAMQKLVDAEAADVELDAERRRSLEELQAEGQAARDEFMEKNHRLVYAIAYEHYGHMVRDDIVDIDELAAYGYGAVESAQGPRKAGLTRAIELYDPDTGHRFQTYARTWIRQGMQLGLRLASKSQTRSLDAIADAVGGVEQYIDEDDSLTQAARTLGRPAVEAAGIEMAMDLAGERLSARQRAVVSMACGLDEDGRVYRIDEIARRLGYDPTTGRTIYTVPAVRNDLTKARSILFGERADDEPAAAPVGAGPEAPPETTPAHAGLEFSQLLSDERFATAIERMAALRGPSTVQLLAYLYPDSLVRYDQPDVTARGMQRRSALQNERLAAKAEAMLRQIIDGSFDYAAGMPTARQPMHFLRLMGRIGMPIPPDSSLEELATACRDQLAASDCITDAERSLVAEYFNLAGGPPRTVQTIAAQRDMTYSMVDHAVSTAVQRLTENASHARLTGESPGHRRTIEALARQLPLAAWFEDPRLRNVTERALNTLTARQAVAIERRYGFHGVRSTARQLADELSIYPRTVKDYRSAAIARLTQTLPQVAAGTYDYTADKGTKSFHQGVIEFMVRAGMDIPDLPLDGIRRYAAAELAAADAIETHDKQLLADYYGLATGQRPPTPDILAERHRFSNDQLRRQVTAATATLFRIAAASGGRASGMPPLVPANEFRTMLRQYGCNERRAGPDDRIGDDTARRQNGAGAAHPGAEAARPLEVVP